MGDHNLIEQLFIPKVKDEIATFSNSRPISKSSCIFKVLDIILNRRLWKELKEGVTSKINVQ